MTQETVMTQSELEKLVHAEVKRGLEWADAKAKADQLEGLLPHLEAALMLEEAEHYHQETGGKLSDERAKRQARARREYRDAIMEMVEAKKQANELRVRYVAYERLFEAARTQHVSNRKQDDHGRYL